MGSTLNSIFACGGNASGKMIGDSQNLGNSVLPRHSAYAFSRDIGIHTNGRDKEWIPGSATKNRYDSGATANSRERSLGDADDWRASRKGLIQVGSETGPPEGRQPYIAVNYAYVRQRRNKAKYRNKARQLSAVEAARLIRLYRLDGIHIR